MYLILRCDELGDQWECDANRAPIAIVDNWEKWYSEQAPDYLFEVYEWDGKEMSIIKDLYAPMEEGMVLCFWESGADLENTPPVILQKWADKTRNDDIPPCVWEEIGAFLASEDNICNDTYKDVRHAIRSVGEYCWETDNGTFVYGEYSDNRYPTGI